jgi:alkylmercury lyase
MASLSTLADALAGTFPACDDARARRALLRRLADGRPVAASVPARWPNVERDEDGRVVAFGGLSLAPTAHRFTVGERRLYTWCAWDTLFLPALLDGSARVRSRCGVTGLDVRLTVDPSGVREVEPEPLWVSFPAPSSTSVADITGSFCCHVHFLAGRAAADEWLSRHSGGTALTLHEAFELGRRATSCLMDADRRT